MPRLLPVGLVDRVTAVAEIAARSVAIAAAAQPACVYPCGDVTAAVGELRDLFILYSVCVCKLLVRRRLRWFLLLGSGMCFPTGAVTFVALLFLRCRYVGRRRGLASRRERSGFKTTGRGLFIAPCGS